jgi:hypothetical protein
MALIVATLLLFAAGPFVLWPLIRTPAEEPVSSATNRTEGTQ